MAEPQASKTQASYQESPYEDSCWEVIGSPPSGSEFVPMCAKVLPSTAARADDLFEDFGGATPEGAVERWHLPGELGYQSVAKKAEALAEERGRTTATEQQAALMKQEAFDAGLAQGRQEAMEAQKDRLSVIEQHCEEVLRDLDKQNREQLERLERDGVGLALAISKKIIENAVEINPEYLVPLLREALQHCGGSRIRKVRVSPQDLEFIEIVGITKQLKNFDNTWQFEADSSVRAGCVVETSAGEIDYQLDKAWERMRDNILSVVR